jgi:hypothetical protein
LEKQIKTLNDDKQVLLSKIKHIKETSQHQINDMTERLKEKEDPRWILTSKIHSLKSMADEIIKRNEKQ